jgi:methyl-accepting chemotaxis protein
VGTVFDTVAAEATVTPPADPIAALLAQVRGPVKDLTARLAADLPYSAELNAFLEEWHGTWKGLLKELIPVSEASFKLDHLMLASENDTTAQGEAVRRVSDEADSNATSLVGLNETVKQIGHAARYTVEVSQQGQVRVQQFLELLHFLEEAQKKTGLFFDGLTKTSQVLEDLLQGIEDISEGLHVLSINAAIEAARSGLQGRGFAVIAGEVQKVAGRTLEASSRAAHLVKDLRSGIDGVSQGLERSKRAVVQGRESGTLVAQELGNTADRNVALVESIAHLEDELEARKDFALTMKEEAAGLDKTKDRLKDEIRQAVVLASTLHDAVGNILVHSGGVRVEWHQSCLKALARLVKAAETTSEPWTEFLEHQISNAGMFSLLYVMDASGKQVSRNVVAPQYRGMISEDGLGESRRDKAYFSEAAGRPEAYLSPIYVSSASQNLCLTVSQRLARGEVLAADISLDALIDLEP